MNVHITLNGNAFEVTGEFTSPETIELLETIFRSWVNAQSDTPGKLDELTAKLRSQTDSLAESVKANDIPAVAAT